ncbi:hypothetical protein TGCAST_363740 [Toxoplasma gondii CAST]|uniref:Uncharacterized protein n=1 Tax=Toxoplasma gondii CAST TaxID=943122 RepID=A0A3R7YLG4_TOXGO|nr:hypothetical protein TGCAST_363740 [Toxoplasma gondii CAST]
MTLCFVCNRLGRPLSLPFCLSSTSEIRSSCKTLLEISFLFFVFSVNRACERLSLQSVHTRIELCKECCRFWICVFQDFVPSRLLFVLHKERVAQCLFHCRSPRWIVREESRQQILKEGHRQAKNTRAVSRCFVTEETGLYTEAPKRFCKKRRHFVISHNDYALLPFKDEEPKALQHSVCITAGRLPDAERRIRIRFAHTDIDRIVNA